MYNVYSIRQVLPLYTFSMIILDDVSRKYNGLKGLNKRLFFFNICGKEKEINLK